MVGVLRGLPFQLLRGLLHLTMLSRSSRLVWSAATTATSLTDMAVKLHRQALLRYQFRKFTKVN
jgi:hypothetical protein